MEMVNARAELREVMELMLNQYQISPQEAGEIAASFVSVFDMYVESEVQREVCILRKKTV